MPRGCRGDSWIPRGAALLLLSCASPHSEVIAGAPPPPAREPRPRAELAETAKAWPRATAPFVSLGHADGTFLIDIRVSPAAIAAFRGLVLGKTMPTGAIAVAFHSRAGKAESTYAMQKRDDGGWEFLVIDAEQRVVGSGALPLCARCHEQAPADSLFVPPSAASSAGPPTDGGR